MASAPPSVTHGTSNLRRELIGVVDRVPETRGIGVVLIDFGQLHRLRAPDAGEATVVFERRARPSNVPFLPMRQSPSTEQRRPTVSHNAGKSRNVGSSPATEWINLGFNCGGAVLAWVGVVGMTSLAPVTGGVSGLGAALLYGGAAASTGQCVVSIARTANVHRGRADINRRWDDSSIYTYTMLAADGVSLIGAGGALRELKMTNAALHDASFSLRRAYRGDTISRPMRRRLTTTLELQGAKRVPGKEINRVVRQRLLDGAAGAIGLFASGYSGIMGEVRGRAWDLVVWITEESGQRR